MVSAQDMFEAVSRTGAQHADFIFKAAAVADYTPAQYSGRQDEEEGRGAVHPPVQRTQDILSSIWGSTAARASSSAASPWRPGTWWRTAGPSWRKSSVDMICANNLKVAGAGFGVDTNVLTLITAGRCGGTAPHVQGGGRRHHPGPGPGHGRLLSRTAASPIFSPYVQRRSRPQEWASPPLLF